MGEVTFGISSYAKIIFHAAKYPHCAVNGVLLADGSELRDGVKNQDLDIIDAVPLFHHSHYVSPMAEIALTQIEALALTQDRVIAGYYAACENFRDNVVEKCPGQKIAEKIYENFSSAIFVVVDNKRFLKTLEFPAIKVHKYSEGKWKLRDSKIVFSTPDTLKTVSDLLQNGLQHTLVDFDNYLDNPTEDWTNSHIDTIIAQVSR